MSPNPDIIIFVAIALTKKCNVDASPHIAGSISQSRWLKSIKYAYAYMNAIVFQDKAVLRVCPPLSTRNLNPLVTRIA